MIAVIRTEDNVYFAADVWSAEYFNYGDMKTAFSERNLPFGKTDSNRHILVGSAFGGANMDMLRCCDSLEKGITYETLLSDIIPEFYSNLKDLGQFTKYGFASQTMVIAEDNRLFMFGECVIEIDDYEVIGDGLSYKTLYGLLDIYKELSPLERIEKSFRDLEKMLYLEKSPIAVMDTKSMSVQFIGGTK